MTTSTTGRWTAVCAYDDLLPERAVAALVGDEQVAVVRLFDGSVHAVGNRDPFTGACVMARGIVGTRDGVDTIASPLHKQAYDLSSGACLEDPGVALPVFAARCVDGLVEVRAP